MRYIYKLWCPNVNHFYIGQTCNLANRLAQHQAQAHMTRGTMLYFYLRQYGVLNWKMKVLYKIDCSCSEILDIEQFFIKALNPLLNKVRRRVKMLGMRRYMKEYNQKIRDDMTYRCDICDLNCCSMYQLRNHFETNKHKRNMEYSVMDYFERL